MLEGRARQMKRSEIVLDADSLKTPPHQKQMNKTKYMENKTKFTANSSNRGALLTWLMVRVLLDYFP